MIFPSLMSLSLLASLPSFAALGGSSDGGGNAVCESATNTCRMAEEFIISDFSEIKGHDIFEQKLGLLRLHFPVFVANLEKAIARKTWYLIPKVFDVLSVEQTNLHFETNQAAYQNDREVFISLKSIERMHENTVAFKLMHESIMAMQTTRDASAVRVVVGKIFAQRPDIKAIQSALAVNHLGVYFTPVQIAQQRQNLKNRYFDYLAHVLDQASTTCRPHDPAITADLLRSTYRGNRDAYSRDGLKIVSNHLSDFANDEIFSSYKAWNSPFSSSPTYGGGMRFELEPRNRLATLENTPGFAAADHPESQTEELRIFINNEFIRTNFQRHPLTYASLLRVFSTLEPLIKEDSFQIRERLAQNPAMIDLLAIQVKMGQNQAELRPDYFPNNLELQRLQHIYRQVQARMSSVNLNQPQALFRRLCQNIESLRAEVQSLRSSRQ